MKVKQLIESLQGCDQNAEVILARDAEGNGYSPLVNYWKCAYYEEDRYIEVGFASLDDLPEDGGYTEEDVLEGGKPAVVLWPR